MELSTDASEKRTTRITVTLPPDNYALLVRIARSKKVSASWVVRDAVDKYLAADIPLFQRAPPVQSPE
ncbi:MAG: CopG family transcriptional regulator [Verrucomicrobiales bacterium]|nr:CopG family transcriptional regulator [Verrucomicrobiales bacterium]